jgi:hypothetical protein
LRIKILHNIILYIRLKLVLYACVPFEVNIMPRTVCNNYKYEKQINEDKNWMLKVFKMPEVKEREAKEFKT